MIIGNLATYLTFAASVVIAVLAPAPYRMCFIGHAGIFVLLFGVDVAYAAGLLSLEEYSMLRRDVARSLFAVVHLGLLWQLWARR